MSPVAAISIASLVGAFLFTAAGFVMGRLRAWADMATATGSLSGGAIEPVPPPRIERGETTEVRTLRADLDDERAALARRAADADALRAKVDELTARLADAERKCEDAEKLRDVEASRRELAIQTEVLKARLVDADYVRDENATLRAATRESNELRSKLRDLEERLAMRGLDMERTIREPLANFTGPRAAGQGPARFKEVLDGLSRDQSVRAATIADDLGFPVETIGDHADALAALSGFLAQVASKARQLLPLSAVRQIVLVDDDENTVTNSRYMTDYGPLALVTLSEGPCPDWQSGDRGSGARPRALVHGAPAKSVAANGAKTGQKLLNQTATKTK